MSRTDLLSLSLCPNWSFVLNVNNSLEACGEPAHPAQRPLWLRLEAGAAPDLLDEETTVFFHQKRSEHADVHSWFLSTSAASVSPGRALV